MNLYLNLLLSIKCIFDNEFGLGKRLWLHPTPTTKFSLHSPPLLSTTADYSVVYTNHDSDQAEKNIFRPDQYCGWCKQHSIQPWYMTTAVIKAKMYF